MIGSVALSNSAAQHVKMSARQAWACLLVSLQNASEDFLNRGALVGADNKKN